MATVKKDDVLKPYFTDVSGTAITQEMRRAFSVKEAMEMTTAAARLPSVRRVSLFSPGTTDRPAPRPIDTLSGPKRR